jgi:hypothetical protein
LLLQKRYSSHLPSKVGQIVSIKGSFLAKKHARNGILSIVHPQNRSSQSSGKFSQQHRIEAFFPEKCNKTSSHRPVPLRSACTAPAKLQMNSFVCLIAFL